MKTVRVLSISLLVLIGGAAIFGGGSLLLNPSGSRVGLPLSLLDGSPFTNYFIPGLVLLLSIGLPSLIIAILGIIHNAYSAQLTVLQGAIVSGWIIVQAIIIHVITPIQVVVGAVGFILFCLGLFQQEDESVSRENRYAD